MQKARWHCSVGLRCFYFTHHSQPAIVLVLPYRHHQHYTQQILECQFRLFGAALVATSKPCKKKDAMHDLMIQGGETVFK